MKSLILISLAATTFAMATEIDFESGSRITNGQDAEPNQFPYQALLHIRIGYQWYYCGGTLISNQWILTAAHCSQSVSYFEVRLGRIYLKGEDGIDLETATYFVHEDYNNPTKYANDIALIMLDSPVETSISIKPAKLPAYSSTPPSYEGETAVTSGWGLLYTDAPFISDTLQYVSVPIISNEECQQCYGNNVKDTNICIGTNITYMSACSGDSGGPLVVDNDILIGITSFGAKRGCELGYPVAYTRVTSYLDWIENISGVSAGT